MIVQVQHVHELMDGIKCGQLSNLVNTDGQVVLTQWNSRDLRFAVKDFVNRWVEMNWDDMSITKCTELWNNGRTIELPNCVCGH